MKLLLELGLKEGPCFQSLDAGILLLEPAIARIGLCMKSYDCERPCADFDRSEADSICSSVLGRTSM